jgi:vanillin dehydrogenase
MPLLRVSHIAAAYGKHVALDDIDLHVDGGEVVVILGANGAGKSTLLKVIAGLVPGLPGGSITLGSRELTVLPPHEIVEAGIALVPEGRGIFGDLTVRENLLLGAHARRARHIEQRNLDIVIDLFPRLKERFSQAARTMSGGEQQMVAIARAMMSAPELLLLDEPSLGLSPMLAHELFEALARVRRTGVSVLLVEQNARQSLRIADRGYLIETGHIVGHGEADDLIADPAVHEAYLGVGGVHEPTLLASEEAPKLRSNGEDSSAPIEIARSSLVPPTIHANADRSSEPPGATPAHARQAKGSPMFHTKLIIADREANASDSRTFDRLDPVTGDVATRAAAASVADAQKAADAAAAAFKEWSAMPPGERRKLLLKAADNLEARVEDFAAAVITETGSPGHWAHFNVGLAADMIREAASMTTQITGEVIPANRPGSISMSVRRPVGVVLSIAPWNAPIILGVRSVAMPLACGNTVVFKTSENCPHTHALIVEAFRDAGLPHGTINLVSNAPEDAHKIVEALIAHPKVRRINFTGSTRIGRIIAQTAAGYLKPVLLELGGKAPLIVLDDADVDEAVNAAAFGAFANAGQICMSTEKIVLDNRIAEPFLKKFAAKASGLPAGDPRGHVVLGSCISRATTIRVAEMIEDAVKKGAKLLTGGPADGTIMQATILDHVTPAMRIYEEESFGPITCVVRVDSEEEAIRVANDTEYGLSASVYSRDIARALKVAEQIESGICHVNGPTVHDEAQMPFGGTKSSGYGRFGGTAAIDEFTELRWITIQTEPMHYPF